MSETLQPEESIGELFEKLEENAPNLLFITNFIPQDAEERKQAFKESKDTPHPDHNYETLEQVDVAKIKREILQTGDNILHHPDLNPKQEHMYEEYVETSLKMMQVTELAQTYNSIETQDEKHDVAEAYRELNAELYGEPDERVYRSLVQEKLQTVVNINHEGEATQLREELFAIIPPSEEKVSERFEPSEQTIAWAHDAAVDLYGECFGMSQMASD